MKTAKTSELSGAALDWAVAKCEGVNEEAFHLYYEPMEPADYDSRGYPEFHYSTVWAQGGPIIERYHPNPNTPGWEPWVATTKSYRADGPTPLIAAMRCFCASRLGDEVEIPKELMT